ncbi:MAG: energy-coupling factor transporter transmembrane protein EcfT [Eggerthellaceae bacterium]|nr:energy-coupling factor transporter transmembrane protein EcfT [Eggerthellaceae bacterium]
MRLGLDTYFFGTSAVHRCDARVKLALLLAYSLTLFFVRTWAGLALCTVLCLAVCAVARVPLRQLLALMIPLYVILGLTIVFNGFRFDASSTGMLYGLGNVSAGLFADRAPVLLVGSFGFVPEGFARGCYYALRIALLVAMSLAVSLTTTSTELTDALYDCLRPLRACRVPTEDIAMTVSVALRFIPLTAEELGRVQAAQRSRGAVFDEGGPIRRVGAWQPVLIPLFVGLFRRADNLALAMESRCYAMAQGRTRLDPRPFTVTSGLTLAGGIALCAAVAVVL